MPTLSESLAIAIQHHQTGQLDVAEQIYQQILAAEPNHADALHLLGVIASQVGRHEIAVEYISRAIEMNGTESAFHSNLGNAFQAQGKLEKAIASHRRALELNPDGAEAHYNLGTTFQAHGKLDEAIAFYRQALELNPGLPEVHNNLGTAFQAAGNLKEAVNSYRRALELKPDYAEAHSNLGYAFQAHGNLDEAIDSHRRALELKPDYAEAHFSLGTAFQAKGMLDEAITCYGQALELKPAFTNAHNNLGAAFQAAGKLEEATFLLGRPPSVIGTVVRGERRGSKLGFPTANLELHHAVRPPPGVYAAEVPLEGRSYRAVVNIGTRPTFDEKGGETIEAHLLDYAGGDLYGRVAEVRFLARIRDEKKFDGPEALKRQIAADIDVARHGV